jgi:hypothetical protein
MSAVWHVDSDESECEPNDVDIYCTDPQAYRMKCPETFPPTPMQDNSNALLAFLATRPTKQMA